MSINGHAVTLRTSPGLAGRLWDFEIDEARLKPRHWQWLEREVLPLLNARGSVSVEGQASRAGRHVRNMGLSRMRAGAVLRFLRENTRRPFHVRSQEWRGEEVAAEAGQADNTEDDWYRAVVVSAWSRSTPPPVPRTASTPRTVRRIIRRDFSRHVARGQNPGSGSPGRFDGLVDLGVSQFRSWLFSDSILHSVGTETSRDAEHRSVDWAVNEVYIMVEHSHTSYPGGHELDQWRTSYTYVYGPPRGFVRVSRDTINRLFVGEQRILPPGDPQPVPPAAFATLSRREAGEAMLIIPPPADAALVRAP